MSIRNRLHYLAFHSDLNAVRFLLGLGAVFTGMGFAWPTAIFPTAVQIAAGNGRHTYSLMAQIAPEWAWSLAFLTQGSVMLYSLLMDYRSRWLLWLDAAFGLVIWTAAVSACYAAYWRGLDRIWEYRPPAIMGMEVAGMLMSWWIFVRYNVGDKRG